MLYLLKVMIVKKVSISLNFEYLKIHRDTRDGYIKCNQLYYLDKEEFNNFDELQNHIKNLQKDSKNKFFKTVVNFKDLPRTN